MHSSETIDAENVRAAIVDSFSNNQYPGDSQLVRNPDYGDGQEIFERLQNKCWQDILSHLELINGPELYWYSQVYTMLTPDSFYYYLPAFLIVAMDLRRADVVGTDLVFLLSLPEDLNSNSLKSLMDQVMSRLSPQQYSAIQKWARYLLQDLPVFPQIKSLERWLY